METKVAAVLWQPLHANEAPELLIMSDLQISFTWNAVRPPPSFTFVQMLLAAQWMTFVLFHFVWALALHPNRLLHFESWDFATGCISSPSGFCFLQIRSISKGFSRYLQLSAISIYMWGNYPSEGENFRKGGGITSSREQIGSGIFYVSTSKSGKTSKYKGQKVEYPESTDSVEGQITLGLQAALLQPNKT